MFIATKYETRHLALRSIDRYIYAAAKIFTQTQVLAMEKLVLETIGYRLTIPTTPTFAEKYMKACKWRTSSTPHLVDYFMQTSLQKYHFLQFLPSQIAAASIFLALSLENQSWTEEMITATNYSESALASPVSELIANITESDPKFFYIRKKFAHPSYGAVSNLKFRTILKKRSPR
jgi:cyclin A